ncbi:GIY-YIG nuclease family protein [Bombilactobacillus thymidiniphilus]|uniref:GIY-YIG nuclease family protein n=1 Tax=Bombilactobacillus thymidiniphilus TaxID=2923363 RepID=A0ABY4PDZ4_9LACO|nr:GIY-YIG nuclease family protein [Bombilactobacillus thymidiniphilus]UQS83487.1 GIY-YIG nuclease family protein [Bombilactobacillus thymidiniphilus]
MTENIYSVYIVLCCDGTLYTGISNDVKKRLKQHNSGHGAKYTKTRRPVSLQYQEIVGDRSQASKREYAIKQLSRQQKWALINQH